MSVQRTRRTGRVHPLRGVDAAPGPTGSARPRGTLIAAACLALALVGTSAQAGDPEAGREKAKQCRTCHGIDGVGLRPDVPNIGGESEFYLTKQLKAFRSGERRAPQMSVIASNLSDEDIADLAAWYSSIEFKVEMPD
ncbi:cytochrome c [Ectothiorhodospiraceae bacterium WFHF3C12]|nr:cytochrome c [Ectothiorhodospiraceae bacterium WFHF3C12]